MPGDEDRRPSDVRAEDWRSMLSLVLHDIGKIREQHGGMAADIRSVRDQVVGLGGRFDSLAEEMREGQGKQDDRITEIATAQAKHSGVMGVLAVVAGLVSGAFSKTFLGGSH